MQGCSEGTNTGFESPDKIVYLDYLSSLLTVNGFNEQNPR